MTVAVGAVVVMAVGSAVADWARASAISWIAITVTVITLVLVARFVTTHGAVANPSELRTPLAELLITMECCRTFTMRTRRDLRFALSSSSAMVAVAASMSLSIGFAIPLLAWAICVAAALAATYRSDLRERLDPLASPPVRPQRRAMLPAVFAITLAVCAAIGVFLLVPAAQSSRFLATMSRLPHNTPVPRQGALSNPTLGENDPSNDPGGGGSGSGSSTSFGYFGFANHLDTGVRGRPDNTLVMRVRASTPDFWRAQSFDVWNGREWSMSDQTTRVLNGGGPILVAPLFDEPHAPSDELIQTYFLETSGPNVIFGAARPTQVFIPQSALFQLRDGTLRTGVELEAGSIYTVVSQRPYATVGRLRASGDTSAVSPELIRRRYGVQAGVPQRVVELASRLSAGQTTTYDKVIAMERWMGANTTYSLDIPPLPANADAVDQFLFVDHTGFCEQIATSLVVMLRSQGIPARLAVGYTSGERNPFTGLFEVRASDAHAWAEVYFPTVGWQAFDPTADVPLSGDPPADAARVGLGTYLKAHLGPYGRNLLSLFAGLVALGGVVTLWKPVRNAIARRRERRGAGWAAATLLRLEAIGQRLGRPRGAGETAREYGRALQRTVLPDERISAVIEAMELDAFGPNPVGEQVRMRAEGVLAELDGVSR